MTLPDAVRVAQEVLALFRSFREVRPGWKRRFRRVALAAGRDDVPGGTITASHSRLYMVESEQFVREDDATVDAAEGVAAQNPISQRRVRAPPTAADAHDESNDYPRLTAYPAEISESTISST